MSQLRILHPLQKACPNCQRLQWPSLPLEIVRGPLQKSPYETFELLENSAVRGCPLCRFVWSLMVTEFAFRPEFAEELQNVPLGDWQISSRPQSIHVWSSVSPKKKLFYLSFKLIDENEVSWHEKKKTRQVKAFEPQLMSQELRTLVKEQILPWMDGCSKKQEDHARCTPARNPTVLPTRLIDVGTDQDGGLKLVEVDKDKQDSEHFYYLILSYCWGQSNDGAKTTGSNLRTRLHGFPLACLPRTIREAILLTRMMGFRYLWIDALCIIQSTDDGGPGDFMIEAPKMGDYYANAECCISASCAYDSDHGFLLPRPLARFPLPPIVIELSDTSTSSSQRVILEGREDNTALAKSLWSSPLMERGWYLQELLLSRRILHWTRNGLYLQCQSSIFLEGSSEVFPFPDRFHLNPRHIFTRSEEDMLQSEGWYKLLGRFSSQTLSFESDRLYAIHGIACYFVQLLNEEYFYGLFRRNLTQGLAWAVTARHRFISPFLEHLPQPGKKSSLFPSWCWASHCPVYFFPLDEKCIFVRDNHPDRPLMFPTNPNNLSFPSEVDTRLFVQAPLIEVSLDNNKAEFGVESMAAKGSNLQCDCIIDEPINDDPFPECSRFTGTAKVQWLVLGRAQKPFEECSGLLVHKISGKESEVYQRYGVLKIWDMGDSEVEDFYNSCLRNITLI